MGDPEELETLRELLREGLGEEAKAQEELILQLSVSDLFELVEELEEQRIKELGLKKARRKRAASKQSYSAEVIVAPPRYALQESALPASCTAVVDTLQGTDVD